MLNVGPERPRSAGTTGRPPAPPPARTGRTATTARRRGPTGSMPPPPGPPGELGVVARRQELVALAGELGELLDDDGAGRHVDAEARVSVAKTHLHQPSAKQASTASLNGGTMPAWWAAMPASSPAEPPAVAEDGEVAVGQAGRARLDDRADAVPLVGRRSSAAPAPHAGRHRVVARGPAEDEDDRRQQVVVGQPVDHLEAPAWRSSAAGPGPGRSGAPAGTATTRRRAA